MDPIVKICGINSLDALDAALSAGADMVGLVRFGRSPRHLGLDEGRALSARTRGKALRVALVVDADDAALAETVEAFDPDLLQLHGSETPERVAAIRARFGRPVMKAVGIAVPGDLAAIEAYQAVADRLLVDAKPPATAEALPGGNGLAFDWRLMASLDPEKPVMLSGGLDSQNVAAAIALTGVRAVDVSSGVERRPGEKDPEKIAAFVKAARAAFSSAQVFSGEVDPGSTSENTANIDKDQVA
jgi:phosphoribosylanthranilate isomerase